MIKKLMLMLIGIAILPLNAMENASIEVQGSNQNKAATEELFQGIINNAAIMPNTIEEVQQAIQDGANVNAQASIRDNDRTFENIQPLSLAIALVNDREIIEALLQAGAEPNTDALYEFVDLLSWLSEDYLEFDENENYELNLFKLLLQYGIDPSANTDPENPEETLHDFFARRAKQKEFPQLNEYRTFFENFTEALANPLEHTDMSNEIDRLVWSNLYYGLKVNPNYPELVYNLGTQFIKNNKKSSFDKIMDIFLTEDKNSTRKDFYRNKVKNRLDAFSKQTLKDIGFTFK